MRIARLAVLALAAPLWADDELVKWMDRLAQEQLSKREAAIAQVHTTAEAQARQEAVRAKILALIGGVPDYSRPLKAKNSGQTCTPRYVIPKVNFASLPQNFIT